MTETNLADGVHPHWLAEVVGRLGLAPAMPPELHAGTPLEEAWRMVARACGITEDELATHVAKANGLEAATLAAAEPKALRLIPERVARRHLIFPLRETDRHIVVASANPNDLTIEADVRFSSGRDPIFEVAPPRAIADSIASTYATSMADSAKMLANDDYQDAIQLLENAAPVSVDAREVEFAPVIKLTNLVLHSAIEQRASDIHFEPGPIDGVVRFRVDGVLHNYMRMPLPALNRVISRVKIMSKLDIADRLRPQDGRASISVQGRSFDLRISSVPTRVAEKVVIRVLAQGASTRLGDIDIPEHQLGGIRNLLGSRNGIVLVTGPTGSGKTTTLYAALRELATGSENIMTVEDPVEYELPGITQIQVENKRGLTFAAALRSLLRQDPDIILVGEIRDAETAHIAAQASLTGHLVLATLHTNDALGAVQRMVDFGLDRVSVASTLRGVIAQRLVRRVCPQCVQKNLTELNAGEKRLGLAFGVAPVARAVGCERCMKSGYMGRIPVLEILNVTPALSSLIATGAPVAVLQKAAIEEGMCTLFEAAVARALAGETTLKEVERVVGLPTDMAKTETPAAKAARRGMAVLPSSDPPSPSDSAQEPDAADDAPAAILSLVDAAPRPAAPTPRILLVDDEPVNRKVARTLLQKNGFEVEECKDGKESVERLKADPNFSLMLLDLTMPQMDGREVLRWVRNQPATRPLPVVVFTASQGESLEADVMNEGADDYIRKPLDPTRFIARIRATLRRAAA